MREITMSIIRQFMGIFAVVDIALLCVYLAQ